MPRDIRVEHPLDGEEIRKLDRQRWRKNGVADLAEGFTAKPDGRAGCIYFRRGPQVLELYYELSGDPKYDILLWLRGFSEWIAPERAPISSAEQRVIRAELEHWLKANGTRAFFDESTAPPSRTRSTRGKRRSSSGPIVQSHDGRRDSSSERHEDTPGEIESRTHTQEVP
jgi:hypothetical protein